MLLFTCMFLLMCWIPLLLNLVIYLELEAEILKHCQCLNLNLSSFTFTAFSLEFFFPALLV